ncbi:MAG: hypothetical protein HON98_01035 [Chloroflexi bacterium]|jgi:YYY domain-containing protein|nr:hypothetical protein [Chloroflexota bacterium]MBT3668881.1 hypothetical protein [Chloroflexota bacterium]MBT4306595.1 hypothetical protein [Chloroflexota bacterium]MBT4533979.1 hypothetical protein [Chloroflexota bacterium]MBT4681418.1 hypothetical protein [Chloroflexota bacterium]
MTEKTTELIDINEQEPKKKTFKGFIPDLLLIILLIVAGFYRLVGLGWDADQHVHPDELFLTNVESAIIPVDNFLDYWDTEVSTLNPHNVGHGFFVYGTLPIFLVRYLAEAVGQTSYGEIVLVGRQVSAIFDLGVVLLVYLAASRLYDKRVGLIASIFSAFTVLQIQASHFFTVDTAMNFFTFLCIYLAILIIKGGDDKKPFELSTFIWFGIALGLAVSSKVQTGVVAGMLPLAVFIRIYKLDKLERISQAWIAMTYMIYAALASLLIFRIFQPYAFSGPGFFGIKPNGKWAANIKYLISQASGDIDWPPSTQWARRPIWFSGQNLVLWGLGLPMGIAAWAGFLWAGWRMLQKEWQQHLLLWGWVAFYFTWQSLAFNPTMRYQMPIYPALAVFAGWFVIRFWDVAKFNQSWKPCLKRSVKTLAAVVGTISVVGTILYATAFIEIYKQPHSRVAISEWIYENIPGPFTISYDNDQGGFTQPIPFAYDFLINTERPYQSSFTAKTSGIVDQIAVHSIDIPEQGSTLSLIISDVESPEISLGVLIAEFVPGTDPSKERNLIFSSDLPISFVPETQYLIKLAPTQGNDPVMLAQTTLFMFSNEELVSQELNIAPIMLSVEAPFQASFSPTAPAVMTEVSATVSTVEPFQPDTVQISLTISDTPDHLVPLVVSNMDVNLSSGTARNQSFVFDKQILFEEGRPYYFKIETGTEGAEFTIKGSALAGETNWDLGLPLRVGYDGYGGIYQRGLDFDMYADDTPQKLERFLNILDQAEYIPISSSRQYASTTRIPERYPLVTEYYRQLIGCPQSQTVEYCYTVADLDTYTEKLGFELIKIEVTNPTLFGFEINDQFSEEAFTVYDHTKTFIFKKTADYDHQTVTEILSAVDLSNMVRLTPKQASAYEGPPPDLLLAEDVFQQQQENGTWSELFDIDSLVNRSQVLTVIIWYLAVMILGLATYPIIRYLMPALADRGYPLIRIAGLLFLAYFSWLGGSIGLGYNRMLIGTVYLLILLVGVWLAYLQRVELRQEMKDRWAYFLTIEMLFLAFFLFSLFVRLGNSDLWHPSKGGEKPMDFAYFNAVLKSASFPPYDPWFAGGYINYYYFGFVYVGSLVKLLGIVPAIAYNLIIPTLFAMLAMGAFSISWNLYLANKEKVKDFLYSGRALTVGIAGALGTAVIGNLGTLKLIFRGYQRVGAEGLYDPAAILLTKWSWAVKGFFQVVGGQSLPYGIGNWYWDPSRAIEVPTDVPITEFPWFTFIYADLHAHMIALPITVLALAWVLSVFFGSLKNQKLLSGRVLGGLFLGGLAIGALRPTNTWDLPTYLALGVVALIYAGWKYSDPQKWPWKKPLPADLQKGLWIALSVLILVAFTFMLYLPFSESYVQAYGSIDEWTGSQTPSNSYWVHWGIFLFILITFLVWETRQWMANTPVSSLRKLEPFTLLIILVILALFITMAIMHIKYEIRVYWIALPLALWSAVMLLRPKLSENKKAVYFLIGTSFFLTLMVETIVLVGDIGRMNTVFKFYLQVWVIFGTISAAALGWILDEIKEWKSIPRFFWQTALAFILFLGFLYPFTATAAKIRDRFTPEVSRSLDGMAYMEYSTYSDQGAVFNLAQDYRAIQWLQQNIEGTPVIVEGVAPIYRWGSRISIYTGLPTVLGWEWHQIQQRAAGTPYAVQDRLQEVAAFYQTEDPTSAMAFIDKFDVSYIVLGQLETAYYPGAGLNKFEELNGRLWDAVYLDEDTVIYKVRD